MSLTRELHRKGSPVRRFLHETFPNTRGPLAACRGALRVPLVADLPAGTHPAAYGQVGAAMDYRIRYHLAVTPPHQLVAFRGALLLIRPHEGRLPASALAKAALIRENSTLTRACVAGFFGALDRAVAAIGPHRRRPDEAEELTLGRLCLVLGAFEAAFRNPLAWPPPYIGDARPDTVPELLALVPDDWVWDVAALGSAFAERHAAWRGVRFRPQSEVRRQHRHRGRRCRSHHGRLSLGDQDDEAPGAQGQWLRQLIGYVLLDYEDEHAIDRVGLLLPRQGTSFSWSVSKLVAELSGRADLDLPSLRERFRQLCEPLRARGDAVESEVSGRSGAPPRATRPNRSGRR